MKVFSSILLLLLSYSMFSQGDWIEESNFGTNPGELKMYYYVPNNISGDIPLVVALHGCTQTAEEYKTASGWNKLADEIGFIVLYPEQQSANNVQQCFNWFFATDNEAGTGEAGSIMQMIDFLKSNYSIDNSKVFATGLSAGAGMANALLAAYPQMFEAGALFAGTPYKSASNATEAYNVMQGMVDKTPEEWGSLILSENPTYFGTYPRVSVFHGTLDNVVASMNMTEVIEQWTYIHNIEITDNFEYANYKDIDDITCIRYPGVYNANKVVSFEIENMGHAIPVNPGDCSFEGGTTGLYAIDKGFHGSYFAARFFDLINDFPIEGKDTVAFYEQPLFYSVPEIQGRSYDWGAHVYSWIASGENTNQATIHWGDASGFVWVEQQDNQYCIYPKEEMYVYIDPTIDIIEKISINNHLQRLGNIYSLKSNNYSLKLLDITGKLIYQSNKNIDINAYPSGVYLLLVVNNKGENCFLEKIVKE